jgi:SAM-dependent methyltransferase
MHDLNETVSIHRKSWEYAMCVHGLDALGVVHPEAVGLAVGAGSERPLYHYANTIRRIIATDLYDTEAHEGTPLMLNEPERFAPFAYRQDHLEVLRMPADRLDFPDASFDFVFCLSSIEHFGSRETQRRSLDEMARVLKCGGVACIITELILTDHSDGEYFRWDEIEEIFLRHPLLHLEGGEPDLSISESLLAFPVDLTEVTWPLTPAAARRLNRSPHIVLKRGEMLWTSFSMFLRRVGGEAVSAPTAVGGFADGDDADAPVRPHLASDPRAEGRGEEAAQRLLPTPPLVPNLSWNRGISRAPVSLPNDANLSVALDYLPAASLPNWVSH